ncbi:MAG: aspartate aminotransferase family protein [Victivallales bacterium]|jgi:predicted acetylornithine/succinylornithine family transaminase
MDAGKKNYREILEFQDKYVMHTYSPEMLLIRGKGSYVWDSEDRKHLDFSAGISVCNLGHCHPSVTKAVCEQAGKLVHVSNLFMNENQPLLAKKLVEKGFDGFVFFANSGAEANEGMIKLARKWGSDKGCYEIIVMEESFHGRTLATLAATGRSKYRAGFSPDMPGFVHVPFNDLGAIEKKISDKTCAVLLEPVQGEGGIIPAGKEFIEGVRKLCDKHGILLMFDEVQCGMGRTGTFYAWQGYGVKPDALSMAKALGNGFPIGAFMVKRELGNVLGAGTHASTFGGTPLACAAAIAVLDTFDSEKTLENCAKQGAYLMAELAKFAKKYPCIKEVRGKGLIIGVVLDRPANDLKKIAGSKGLLVLTAGETVLRLLPPLNISRQEADEALHILDESLKQLQESQNAK